jgi:hypothetical protein
VPRRIYGPEKKIKFKNIQRNVKNRGCIDVKLVHDRKEYNNAKCVKGEVVPVIN